VRKGRTEGGRRGLGIQMGRKGVVRDREGEEGTKSGGLYRGNGWEEREGEEGEESRKEERHDLAPNKIPGSATAGLCMQLSLVSSTRDEYLPVSEKQI
jgi:hypothetical protein